MMTSLSSGSFQIVLVVVLAIGPFALEFDYTGAGENA
jgi:hypothetical protein